MAQANGNGNNKHLQLRLLGGPGWIYVLVEAKTGWGKIGWSDRPDERFREIQAMSSQPLERVALIPGSQRDEKLIHVFLDALGIPRREGSEWFRLRQGEHDDLKVRALRAEIDHAQAEIRAAHAEHVRALEALVGIATEARAKALDRAKRAREERDEAILRCERAEDYIRFHDLSVRESGPHR